MAALLLAAPRLTALLQPSSSCRRDVVASLVGRDAVEQAGIQEIKDKLFQSTEEAVRRGAFGAPTFFVKDEMFFGHDRLHLMEHHLNGQI